MPLFENLTKQINNYFKNLDKAHKRRLIMLACLFAVILVVAILLLGQKEYTTLYRGLKPSDAGEIMEKLKEMKIDAKAVGDDTIMVLKEQEPGVRMQLASMGYPKSGLNYDLYMNSVGFGTTEDEKSRYYQFQLQDRLQDAICTLEGVKEAIVTISFPDEDNFVFKGDKKPVTASVIIKLEDGYQMSRKQVQGIEALVSKSVSGLLPENISIIDTDMNLLNNQWQDEDYVGSQLDIENQVRARLERQVSSLLEPVFGIKGVMAAVNVRLDFDSHKTESIRFEPVVDDEGIVASITELTETMKGSNISGIPGEDSNNGIPSYPSGEDSQQVYEKVSRTVNYEINQIKEQLEKAKGQISELSISVLIDKKELDPAISQKVQSLVSGAIGVDADDVIVENMEFSSRKSLEEQISEAFNKGVKGGSDLLALALYGVLALVVLAAAFVMYRILNKKKVREAVAVVSDHGSAAESVTDTEYEESALKTHVEKLVKQNPAEAARLLRVWINEE
ncbi:MAG TPA: flagellar basal-body MS-ring/collar protein FliF [Clostridia bacterium]|nr:flagellar basal-body MS-ring/collar protein FliF [Clostridia bacterium]